ncbi:TPA: hypothetical protein ACHT8U_003320 [Acinetobacter baumannii]|uniref:RelA/SpoT family protein n=2 Tax=Acinetobacter baumannii TaxID=470 RepID=A0A8B5UBR2_ACIBA|nr:MULTISPECIES: hypothetical protein [Acinetobacter calcoaceticus/baumannii complex]EHU1617245.1 hypothetical protein [Acinetobacter baumannii]EKV3593584.1 hypothetical protein [Acinetobacter baumannii]ELA7629730.1 hypothetical protein [Acinetobacter baumannii]EYT45207.1 hypothetical protein J619_02412 [Acinetobacter sp. 478810]MDI9823240.1 hypothetical protein [Acinetobacter baumannii]
MSLQNTHYLRILNELTRQIDSEFNKIGLLYRLFGRVKTPDSLKNKLELNPQKYQPDEGGKKIQDVIGLRITLYFTDDVDIAIEILKKIFVWDQESSNIDGYSQNTFDATRCNLIFALPSEQCHTKYLDDEGFCDNTFEVQIRTVFSEGWHEVEHDLRYKHKDDWKDFEESYRTLNGFLANLETVDWGILQLLSDLTWKHYKAQNWEAMLRNKMRVRISKPKENLDEKILEILNNDPNGIGKHIFRANRKKILNFIFENKLQIPLTLSNLVYIINEVEPYNSSITEVTPPVILNKIRNN